MVTKPNVNQYNYLGFLLYILCRCFYVMLSVSVSVSSKSLEAQARLDVAGGLSFFKNIFRIASVINERSDEKCPQVSCLHMSTAFTSLPNQFLYFCCSNCPWFCYQFSSAVLVSAGVWRPVRILSHYFLLALFFWIFYLLHSLSISFHCSFGR